MREASTSIGERYRANCLRGFPPARRT